MRKMRNNRRAVSPVIATVLMILITMIGMTILFAFVSSYSESYKAGIGSSVLESVSIEDIWLRSNAGIYSNQTQISIYNVGKVDLTVNSIYVNGSKLVDSSSNLNLNINIKSWGARSNNRELASKLDKREHLQLSGFYKEGFEL